MNPPLSPDLRHQEAILLLKELIRIPRVSREEIEVADFLEARFKSLGLKPERYLNHVWMKNVKFDEAKPTLLLNSHLDTVKPNSGYSRNPYDPEIKDGMLFGLGSNDAGASVVCLFSAFQHFFNRSDLKYNLIFAASSEEEISGTNGMEALLKVLPPLSCAIVGEPTSMQMAVAEKGLMVLDCTATGVSGHAAREEGDNAIYKAMLDIEWFKSFRFDRVSPLLGSNKMSVTQIQAGTQHNVVPRECQFTVDVRVNELYELDQVLKTIQSQTKSRVEPRSFRIKSTSIEMTHPLVLAGLSLGLSHYGSPTTSDKALMPFPALKIGPGDSSRSHTANEFVFLSQIEEGIETYLRLLEKFLLEKIT